MRNYQNQIVCFKYATHRQLVKCERKCIFTPKSGKICRIITARFFSLYMFYLQDLFSPLHPLITLSLYLFQCDLSKQDHTFSNMMKSFSEFC